MTFIEQIERQRQKLGWTYRELGERIGRQDETVRKWLKGERTPNPDDLARMAKAVGLKILRVPILP